METPRIEFLMRGLGVTGYEGPVDPSRAQATYCFIVRNVARLTKVVQSPHFMIRSMQWRLRVIPNDVGLGVFVHCSGKHDSPNWSCNATVELRLLGCGIGAGSYVKGPIQHLFNAEKDDYGYAVFIKWQKLLCLADAFVAFKGIFLEVNIIADAPQGLDN